MASNRFFFLFVFYIYSTFHWLSSFHLQSSNLQNKFLTTILTIPVTFYNLLSARVCIELVGGRWLYEIRMRCRVFRSPSSTPHPLPSLEYVHDLRPISDCKRSNFEFTVSNR